MALRIGGYLERQGLLERDAENTCLTGDELEAGPMEQLLGSSLTANGNVRYQLKTPYRDGTTHVIFEPLDFIARLAALVPKPRVNLTCFHGVFAPNSKHRERVTPTKRGSGGQHAAAAVPRCVANAEPSPRPPTGTIDRFARRRTQPTRQQYQAPDQRGHAAAEKRDGL